MVESEGMPWPSALSSGGLTDKIQSARILCIGAGGIGCELLKTLVCTGFRHIELVTRARLEVLICQLPAPSCLMSDCPYPHGAGHELLLHHQRRHPTDISHAVVMVWPDFNALSSVQIGLGPGRR